MPSVPVVCVFPVEPGLVMQTVSHDLIPNLGHLNCKMRLAGFLFKVHEQFALADLNIIIWIGTSDEIFEPAGEKIAPR